MSTRGDDGVERLPAARRLPRPAVDHEVVRSLRHFGIEVVHEHPQRRFLLPPLAGEGGTARRRHPPRAGGLAKAGRALAAGGGDAGAGYRGSAHRSSEATTSNRPSETAPANVSMSWLNTRSAPS